MSVAARSPAADSRAFDTLASVLDGGFRTAVLREAAAKFVPGSEPPRGSRLNRVHMRGDGGFVAEAVALDVLEGERQFFMEIPGASVDVGIAEIERRIEKQHRRSQRDAHVGEFVHFDRENGIFVRPRGIDELIDGLAAAIDPSLLGGEAFFEGELASADVLSHRLNRRAVLHARTARGTERMVKLYKKGSSKADRALAITSLLQRTSFGPGSPISVPRGLAPLRSWPGYAMERAPGEPLSALDRVGGRLAGMRKAGAALGRLHRLPLRLEQSHALPDHIGLLSAWTGLASGMFPAQSQPIGQAFAVVRGALLDEPRTAVTLVHRDFHPGQLLVSEDSATLIDFDTVCNGDPSEDVGNFLAHLDLARLEHPDWSELEDEEFLSGYASAHRAPGAARVRAYRRAALLRLACIYAFSDRHRLIWPRLLGLASGEQI